MARSSSQRCYTPFPLCSHPFYFCSPTSVTQPSGISSERAEASMKQIPTTSCQSKKAPRARPWRRSRAAYSSLPLCSCHQLSCTRPFSPPAVLFPSPYLICPGHPTVISFYQEGAFTTKLRTAKALTALSPTEAGSERCSVSACSTS